MAQSLSPLHMAIIGLQFPLQDPFDVGKKDKKTDKIASWQASKLMGLPSELPVLSLRGHEHETIQYV